MPTARPRIIVATPHAAEFHEIADCLSANTFEPVRSMTAKAACEEITTTGAAMLVADAIFAFQQGLHAAWRARYPQLSAIVIGALDAGAQRAAEGLRTIYLPRPVDGSTLLCMVSMAIVESRPVRCSPRKPVSFSAIANGVSARLVDVSQEGLRLELPRERRAPAPPLYFRVSVPTLGIAMMVQRRWTSLPMDATQKDVTWCGVVLSQNSTGIEHAWHRFVDMVPDAGVQAEAQQG